MQVRDDRRVNFSKFGVIHKEPAFPGAADGSGLYRCFLGVRGGKARLQRGAADGLGQCQRGGTGIQENEALPAAFRPCREDCV